MKFTRQAGFTLLEVLLVALLMGLTAAAVTMTTSTAGPEQALTKTARQFIATTELVIEETILSGQFLGIVVEEDEYQFVYYKDGKWEPLTGDRQLAPQQMEEGVMMSLLLDGLPLVQDDEEDESWFDEPLIDESKEDKKKNPEPQILLFPSGEMSTFELSFLTDDANGKEVEVLVVGDAMGRLALGSFDEDL
ncbi:MULTISPECIES: type II secretion system minor pseudopilin GspH [Shewanella]|uniref:Type II secretion system protein H n=1 Tax=Shewanella japonica TaxID=93973 RepID=A0ABN4YL58_9GAMM|nr:MULTISPECIES: type II secretion system minor pseudopilin GspH [Shewanella]ARD24260.1 Type II secretion system protein H [Shewanella japonica]MBQ4891972.1 type II secretion system minor pseudopilin GspH [Shewanella sp. MMG014]OBT04273.1 type II secretion system protein GspH [Shewanella sp. UCD-FRSSP16_17]